MFNKISKSVNKFIIPILVSITMVGTVDFSGLTDLVNATMTVLNTFVTNGSTLVSFIVLIVELGLVSVIGTFIALLLLKVVKRIDGKM